MIPHHGLAWYCHRLLPIFLSQLLARPATSATPHISLRHFTLTIWDIPKFSQDESYAFAVHRCKRLYAAISPQPVRHIWPQLPCVRSININSPQLIPMTGPDSGSRIRLCRCRDSPRPDLPPSLVFVIGFPARQDMTPSPFVPALRLDSSSPTLRFNWT